MHFLFHCVSKWGKEDLDSIRASKGTPCDFSTCYGHFTVEFHVNASAWIFKIFKKWFCLLIQLCLPWLYPSASLYSSHLTGLTLLEHTIFFLASSAGAVSCAWNGFPCLHLISLENYCSFLGIPMKSPAPLTRPPPRSSLSSHPLCSRHNLHILWKHFPFCGDYWSVNILTLSRPQIPWGQELHLIYLYVSSFR